MRLRHLTIVPLCLLGGCSFFDSHTAHKAQKSFIGVSEVDLQACLGAPDQHSTFGTTDILTYVSASTSNGGLSLSFPLIGGVSLSGGGYCHATFRVQNGIVTALRYSGEKNATFASDAYCAPIVRSCLDEKDSPRPVVAIQPAPATTAPGSPPVVPAGLAPTATQAPEPPPHR